MKVWITQCALTKGVFTADVTISELAPTMAYGHDHGWPVYYHKPHWHETAEEAYSRVHDMVVAKRRSLRKQLDKLDNFVVTVPT